MELFPRSLHVTCKRMISKFSPQFCYELRDLACTVQTYSHSEERQRTLYESADLWHCFAMVCHWYWCEMAERYTGAMSINAFNETTIIEFEYNTNAQALKFLQRSRIMSMYRQRWCEPMCTCTWQAIHHRVYMWCSDGAVHVIVGAQRLAEFPTHTVNAANQRHRFMELWHSRMSYDRFISSEIIFESVSLGHFSLVLCVRKASSVFIIFLNTNHKYFFWTCKYSATDYLSQRSQKKYERNSTIGEKHNISSWNRH